MPAVAIYGGFFRFVRPYYERHPKEPAPGSPEGPAEAQAVQAALDVFQIDLNIVLKDIAGGVSGAAFQQAIQALKTSLVDLVRAELHFAADTRADAGKHAASSSGSAQRHGLDILDDIFAGLGTGRGGKG